MLHHELKLLLGLTLILLLLLVHEPLQGLSVTGLKFQNLLECDVGLLWLVTLLVKNAEVVPYLTQVWLQGRCFDYGLKRLSILLLQKQ